MTKEELMRKAIGGYLPLEKVYSYNPVPDSISADKQDFILGVQANLWASAKWRPLVLTHRRIWHGPKSFCVISRRHYDAARP